MLGTKVLEEANSKYNGKLRVLRTWGMGTYIQANGLSQSGGIVETIWKQTLKKVKMQKSKAKNVLILGLGGGTVVKLIHKNWPDAKIIGVDIDPVMIELGTRHLALDNSRVEIKITDAFDFVSSAQSLMSNAYDLVIVDLYNGDKFPKKFEDKHYIHLVRSILSRSGFVIFNRLYYKEKKEEAKDFKKKLKLVFNKVEEFKPLSNIMFFVSK